METILGFIGIVIGVIGIAISICAILYAKECQKESRNNYDKTKDVLHQIQQVSALIHSDVDMANKSLIEAVTEITKRAVPEAASPEMEMMKSLLPLLLKNPQAFQTMIQMGQQVDDRKKKNNNG